MTKIITHGVTSASSRGVDLSSASNQDLADPFDETTVTWTEIVASTSEDWAGFYAMACDDSTTSTYNGIVLVATGAASSESIVGSFPVSLSTKNAGNRIFLPIAVSSGARVSMAFVSNSSNILRAQINALPASEFVSTPSFVSIDSGPYDLSNWNTFSSSSFSVSADPGATANTKSAYVEVSFTGGDNDNNVINGDSLGSYDYFGFMFRVSGTSVRLADVLVDVARGAASSEVSIADDIYNRTTNDCYIGNVIYWVKWGRASGDRISFRVQSTNTSSSSRRVQIVLFGARTS